MALRWESKDPDDVDDFHIIWCSKDGTNDGSTADSGLLQGNTIAAVTWTTPTGITKDSENTDVVIIDGITYDVDTVTTIRLSGGTDDTEYTFLCHITDSDGREFDQSVILPVKEN